MTLKHTAILAISLSVLSTAAFADTPPTAALTAEAAHTVPLTQLSNGKFAVDATINGKGPYKLLVDTGAEVMVIKPEIAAACGLTVTDGNVEVQGPTGGFVPVGQADVETASIAGITMIKPVCTVETMSLPCDGLIGAPLFNMGVVKLDLAAQTLTTYTADAFTPDKDLAALPIIFGKGRVPVVDSSIGGLDAHLEIDTGSAFPSELNNDFVDTNKLRDKFTKIGKVGHTSVSGPSYSDVFDMQSLRIGGMSGASVDGQIAALFLDPKPGAPKREFDGRVGCPLLTGTVMTFDYAKATMYFDPHPSTPTPPGVVDLSDSGPPPVTPPVIATPVAPPPTPPASADSSKP